MEPINIGEVRRGKGVTQVDLAKELEVTPRHISHIEIGASRPSPELITKISERLGIDADALHAQFNRAPADLVDRLASDLGFIRAVRRLLDEKEGINGDPEPLPPGTR